MISIQPFDFKGTPVRALSDEKGNPVFCGKDVAVALGYQNTNDAIAKHCKGVAKRYPLQTAGGTQEMAFINEGDLYRLIASSKLPSAQEFESWIFDEVIPQIRQTGGYIPQGETPEETMARAVLIAQKTIQMQKQQLAEQQPKVLFADAVAASHTNILVGDLAKILHSNGIDIGGTRLFQWLRDNGYLMKSGMAKNMPTQKSMELGLFKVKETTVVHADGHTSINKTPKVTGKGQAYFVNKFLAGKALVLA